MYKRGESLASRPTRHSMSALRSLPACLAYIPGRHGLPEHTLLHIRQAWPQVDGRRLLTCLCGQQLSPCGYVQLLQLCISGIALTPCGCVWLLQLSCHDPLWRSVVIAASDIIYAKMHNNIYTHVKFIYIFS